jgi:hypothetical protein
MRLHHRPRMSLIIMLAMLLTVSSAVVRAADLNPPIPADATDVHCSTSPNGTVCHYTRIRGGTDLSNWNDVVCDGFTISYTFTALARYRASYGAEGNLVEEAVHIGFTGTLMNSTDPSKMVPYEGHWTRTTDLIAMTETITGIHQRVILPGQGLVSANIGRIVFDLNSTSPSPEFVAGQWDAFPGVEMNTAALCQALS